MSQAGPSGGNTSREARCDDKYYRLRSDGRSTADSLPRFSPRDCALFADRPAESATSRHEQYAIVAPLHDNRRQNLLAISRPSERTIKIRGGTFRRRVRCCCTRGTITRRLLIAREKKRRADGFFGASHPCVYYTHSRLHGRNFTRRFTTPPGRSYAGGFFLRVRKP